jgi:hypothetical protein
MTRVAGPADVGYTLYSQRDLRWAWKKIGKSGKRFHDFGCLITCLAMLVGRRPDDLNEELIAAHVFSEGANLDSRKAAQTLGLVYSGKVEDVDRIPAIFPTIREVDYTRDGGDFVRHFVLQVRGEDGRFYLIDPYGGVKRPLGYYRFISYRLFSRRPAELVDPEAPPADREPLAPV